VIEHTVPMAKEVFEYGFTLLLLQEVRVKREVIIIKIEIDLILFIVCEH
jgi:hypothetical protein